MGKKRTHLFSETSIPRSESNAYKDLRSRHRNLNRCAKQTSKYYGYRGVDPAWLGKPYIAFEQTDNPADWTQSHSYIKSSMAPLITYTPDAYISTWTKRDMWLERENDIWPLDRRHHISRRKRERYSMKTNELALGRRMKQRQAEWGFVTEDARDLIKFVDRNRDIDVDTVYWEQESRWWDDVEEIWNDRGELVITERKWFDDHVGRSEENQTEEVEFDEPYVDVTMGVELELEYVVDFGDVGDDALSMWSIEDDFEMVDVG